MPWKLKRLVFILFTAMWTTLGGIFVLTLLDTYVGLALYSTDKTVYHDGMIGLATLFKEYIEVPLETYSLRLRGAYLMVSYVSSIFVVLMPIVQLLRPRDYS